MRVDPFAAVHLAWLLLLPAGAAMFGRGLRSQRWQCVVGVILAITSIPAYWALTYWEPWDFADDETRQALLAILATSAMLPRLLGLRIAHCFDDCRLSDFARSKITSFKVGVMRDEMPDIGRMPSLRSLELVHNVDLDVLASENASTIRAHPHLRRLTAVAST